ncbi:uncharacterized protein LOC127858904 [Dreissena polymorpha]|uniref:Ig-like domain-containing protein n=1 Tax=Dreissena polymorpha TaxID=45954 RepID=A0A9D3Z1V3_DREPO|nr:uncharacterized protein LOC127858904 [Dreissena polymorpha]KAH3710169.1 hypothetical protein DPMN_069638 [Dreissena polymorpha]
MLLGFIVCFTLINVMACQGEEPCDGQLKALHRAFDGRNWTLVFEPKNFTGTMSVEWWKGYVGQWSTLERSDTRYSLWSDKNAFMMTINKVDSDISGSIFIARMNIEKKYFCDSNNLTLSVEGNPCGSVFINSQQTSLPIVKDTDVYINYTPSNVILHNREAFTTSWVQDQTGDGRQTKMMVNNTSGFTILQENDGRTSVIIRGMRLELNGYYGVRCLHVGNQTETLTNTESVIIPDKPTLEAFCFDGQRNSGFACEEMFAILSINNTVICNTTAGTHPYQVDVLLDGNRVKTLVSGDLRKADIRITDGNQPFHEVNCTASYIGYNYNFSIVKKLHVIVPVEKPEMLISELKDNFINITCSSIGRPTPYLSILIGKEVGQDLIRTNQFDSSRGMNKSVIFMKDNPDKLQMNNVTCCSQQMVDIVGYQRNVCSDAREINIEYPPKVTFDVFDALVLKNNETINVMCTVNSNPQSNILWRTDDKVLKECNKTSLCLLSVNGSAIKGEEFANKTFRCHAENKLGNSTRDLFVSSVGHSKQESTSDRNENTNSPSLIVWLGGGIGAFVLVTGIIAFALCRRKSSDQKKLLSSQSDEGAIPLNTTSASVPVYAETSKTKKPNAKSSAADRKIPEAPTYSEVSKVKKINTENSAAEVKEDQLVYVELDKTALSQHSTTIKLDIPIELTEYVDINFAKTEELANKAKGQEVLKVDADDKTYMNSGEVK